VAAPFDGNACYRGELADLFIIASPTGLHGAVSTMAITPTLTLSFPPEVPLTSSGQRLAAVDAQCHAGEERAGHGV
jgi:hypothetical protein